MRVLVLATVLVLHWDAGWRHPVSAAQDVVSTGSWAVNSPDIPE